MKKFYQNLNIEWHFEALLISMKIEKPSAEKILTLICENEYEIVYPNVQIVLTIFLSLMVSNCCSGERSFSVLRRVKNYLRSTTSNERLNALALLCIENDLNRQINFEHLIEEFALKIKKNCTVKFFSNNYKNYCNNY